MSVELDVDVAVDPAPEPDVRPVDAGSVDVGRWTVTPHVLAVLVSHDGEAFLPRALAAAKAQTRAPDQLVGIDTGSGDDSAQLLMSGLPEAVRADGVSYGAAVSQAVAAHPAEREPAWLWLLHDDAAPAPDALERLLAAVETAPSVAVAGCKQVSWDDGQRLLDVGFTTSLLGAVVTSMDRGEVDQGQHDLRSDVLAVGTAGMLVRRDVWQTLGGPDPGLTGARADLDICRRARLAGHRVVVVPTAVVAHACAGATGRRPGSSWYRDERRDALFLRLASVRGALLPLALLWSVVAAGMRSLSRLVLKQPAQAVDELLAMASVLVRPDHWMRARRRVAAARRVPARALAPLRPTLRQLLRLRRDEVAAWIVPADRRGAGGAHSAASPGPADAAAAGRFGTLVHRVTLGFPAFALVALAAAVAGRRVLSTAGAVVGPYLPPAPGSAGVLRQAAAASWRAVGLGTTGVGDPLAGVLAELSLVVGGDPGRLVAVLLVGGPVLAAATAWLAAPAVTSSWVVRTWAALAWAGAPPLLVAALSGRPGAVLAHILLPLLGVALFRTVRDGSVAAAAAAGLLLAVLLAAAPSLAVAAVAVLLLMAALATLAAGARRSLLLLLTAVVPAVLLLPWWVAVIRQPELLLADPTGHAEAAAPVWWRLLLQPGSPGDLFGAAAQAARPSAPALAPLAPATVTAAAAAVVAVPFVVLGVAALLRRRRPGTVALVCWIVTAAGLAVALAGERVPNAAGGTWTGPGLSLAAFGLLAAALVVAPAIANRLRGRSFGVRHLAAAVLAVLCTVGPLLALTGFAWQGWDRGQVTRANIAVLPAVATGEAQGPARTRTLVIAVDPGSVRWTLARGAGERLGDDSVAARMRATELQARDSGGSDAALVTPVVAALLSDSVQDVRGPLADLAVGSVVLVPPLDDNAEQALDNAPGLVRVATSAPSLLWRVEPPAVGPQGSVGSRPSRVRVLSGTGAAQQTVALPSDGLDVDTALPPGSAGRLLVLAERADSGWHAALDGNPLPRSTYAGWAQAFALPAAGGRLEVAHSGDATTGLNGLRLVTLVLAALIALPLPRVTRRVAAPAPARRSRPVVRDPAVLLGPLMLPTPKVFDETHPVDGELEPMLAEPPKTRLQKLRERAARRTP